MSDTTEADVSLLLAQIDNLGKSLSPGSKKHAETRKRLRLAAHDLTRALEEPGDIVERVCFSVGNIFPLNLSALPMTRSELTVMYSSNSP